MEIIVGLCLLLVCSVSAEKSEIVENMIEEKKNSTPICDDNLFPFIEQLREWNVHEAEATEFPYHVGILATNQKGHERLVCQGALITRHWILTAGNCIRLNMKTAGDVTFTAVMGTVNYISPEAVVRKLSYYSYHPQFDKKTGYGIDLAMWMMEKPLDKFVLYPKPVRLYNTKDYVKPDCKYSSYVRNRLFGNVARLSKELFCEFVGVVDDARQCVVMNNTIHDRVMIEVTNYELGAPITCSGTLYGIRNKSGYFTTVIFRKTRKWINIVVGKVAKLQTLQRAVTADDSKELDYFKLDLNPDNKIIPYLKGHYTQPYEDYIINNDIGDEILSI